jgi:tripartite-type tricarboxylate transporter receptor subunit TctC
VWDEESSVKVTGQIESRALRALAVASAGRTEFLPGVPTLQEAGVTDLNLEFWSGLFAPAGTSPAIIEKLRAIVTEFLGTDELKSRAVSIAMKPLATSPADLRAMIESQSGNFEKLRLRKKSRSNDAVQIGV